MSEFHGIDPSGLFDNVTTENFSVDKLVEYMHQLREKSKSLSAVAWHVAPLISPFLVPTLEAHGYVEDGKWTTKGLYWLSGFLE